jgi:hypothetical protein
MSILINTIKQLNNIPHKDIRKIVLGLVALAEDEEAEITIHQDEIEVLPSDDFQDLTLEHNQALVGNGWQKFFYVEGMHYWGYDVESQV